MQHRFNAAAYTQTDPPGGRAGPGAESDIYDSLAVTGGAA